MFIAHSAAKAQSLRAFAGEPERLAEGNLLLRGNHAGGV
jgi:hypothetical protein